MLRRARAEVAAVDGWVAATCARLPFATGGLDLVTCAQSFHWFDDVEGQAEIARVLRPAGRLALVWNVRRQETAMDRAYAAVARRAQEAAAAAGRTVHSARTPRDLDAALFTVERRLELANPQRVDRDGLVARAESASYFPRAGALKAQLIAELEEAFDRHAVNGAIALSQVTELTVARRQ